MLILRSGASSVVVSAELGGGVTGWMLGRTPILRRALPRAAVSETAGAGDPHALGCFPLVPYGNRIGGGAFRWRGTGYALRRNFGDSAHSIHGVGWQRCWTVVEAGSASVELMLDHRADPYWPFAFQAALGYRLSEDGLTITMRLTNRHDGPAPAGIGVHPYFPKANDPSLQFNATGVWDTGSGSLPLRHGPPPAEWRHRQPRRVAGSGLDNCFTDWDGTAAIQAGSASLRIEASAAFRHLQVFTPSWADFFCVEPVSHVPDALNRDDLPAGQAMHVLAPGEVVGGTIRFILAA